MLTGVQRYIVNNYSDEQKNDCIKILLNKSCYQKKYGVQGQLSELMSGKEVSKLYESWKELRVGVLTWNLAGKGPGPGFDMSSVVLPNGQEFGTEDVDLYVVGLQEMVKLDMVGSVMCNKDEERILAWQKLTQAALHKRMPGRKFACISRKVMFGCFIMLFVREDHFPHIKQIHTAKVKTGTNGMTANKGSTSLRFNYDDTSFMFLNCHLTSGEKKWQNRFDDLRVCYEETKSVFVA